MGKIKTENADPKFKSELSQQLGSGKIMACFTCRTCTASCPITAVNDKFNPLKVIRMALYGMREEVLGNEFIWLCSSCYACQERCPQGVSITEFMTLLKNMALESGHAPQGIKAQREIICREGRIYPLDDFDNKKRKKIGLPELPIECKAVKDLFPEE